MPTIVGADATSGTRWSGRRHLSSASLLPLLLLLAGAITVLALARADFTTHPTVELYTTEGIMPGVLVEQVNVRCSGLIGKPAHSWFVSDAGQTLFFNESTPTYPDAEVLCGVARGDRWRRILIIGLAGAVLAAGVGVIQLVGRRRRGLEYRPGA